MDPFVLSRNAFKIYCSEYANNNLTIATNLYNNQSARNMNYSSVHASEKINPDNLHYEKAIDTLNQRYEYFLHTLDRLRLSFGHMNDTINNKINSISGSQRENSMSSIVNKRRNHKKHLRRSIKPRLPKMFITVSCAEHLTQQQPNFKMN
ncbi:unnamed protein product [Rotaria socialis]|uniref:Uncharacterized protein n=1 Tax=Rotaria socialis TaxID=392032 RepID=A0A817VCG5_9BILA|nr:unnamed protein product [Rotaria socialis]CAF3658353.1 unnamed protein product [Rotaria socialis]CAF3744303.1 unnamed protein product [Rotaria socialis]CAF4370927.1 unnamed protein product [Rotaria socialis]CAF4472096.1 unnamed protein product [Rotaria socialis]